MYRISEYKKHTNHFFVIEKFVETGFFKKEKSWQPCSIYRDIGSQTNYAYISKDNVDVFTSLDEAEKVLDEILIHEAPLEFIGVVVE